jgi:hypothetical protein
VRRADHLSRGVLPTVARHVWSRNLMSNEPLARVGPQRHVGGGVEVVVGIGVDIVTRGFMLGVHFLAVASILFLSLVSICVQ